MSDVRPMRRFNHRGALPHPVWSLLALFAGLGVTWRGRLIVR
jgi:hypothetical protein